MATASALPASKYSRQPASSCDSCARHLLTASCTVAMAQGEGGTSGAKNNVIGTMRRPGRLPKTLAFLIESSFTFRCRFSVLLCPCLRSKLLSTQSFRENRPFVTVPCFLMPHRRCEKFHSQHRHIRQPAAGVPNGEPAKPLRACISSVRMSQMQPGAGILFREAALSAQCCWRWRAICCLALRRLLPLNLHSSVLHACLTSINRSH